MFDSVFRFLGGGRRSARPFKSKNRVVPTLEALEERWVPTTAGSTLSLQALLGTGVNSLSAPPAVTTSNTPTTPTQQETATFSAFKTGGSQTQSVAQFNSALGTLNSVQIILNGTLSSDVRGREPRRRAEHGQCPGQRQPVAARTGGQPRCCPSLRPSRRTALRCRPTTARWTTAAPAATTSATSRPRLRSRSR